MNIIKKINKSKNKKIIALISSTALIANMFASTSNALTMNSSPLIKDVYFKDKNKGFMYYTSEINDDKGEVVYCMDSKKDSPSGQNFTDNTKLDDVTFRILENGYPNKSITGDNKIDRIITQTAIWAHLDSKNVDINNLVGINRFNNIETEKEDLTNALKTFYNKCTTDTTNRDILATFENTDLALKQEGDILKSNSTKINVSGSNIRINKNATLILESTDIKLEDILIIDKDGHKLPIGELPINKEFTIEISKENVKKISSINNFKIGAKISLESKYATTWKSPDILIQDITKLDWLTRTVNIDNKLNISSDLKGQIKIIKQDSKSNELLNGAIFNIKDKTGLIIETTKPTNNGVVISNELPLGEYKLEEITSPENYIISKEDIDVNLNTIGALEVIVKNEKALENKGSVELTKIDKETKEVLEGAVFELYKENETTPIQTFTTDANGKIKIENFKIGNYFFKEIQAPIGYEIDQNNIYNFEIKNGEVTQITIENMSNSGELFFKKIDLINSNIIDGAKIEIKGTSDSNKDIKIEFESSEEGNKFKLPIGKYEVKEIEAPNGYVLSEEIGYFEIKTINEKVEFEFKNRPMLFHVEILKLDSKDKNKALIDAEFTIYDKDGKELGKGTTNKDGKLRFENLLFGEYIIKETKSPKGYKLNEESLTIKSPEKDGETVYLEVLNTPTKLVQTGGNMSTMLIIALGISLVGGGAIFIVKSKDNKKDNSKK